MNTYYKKKMVENWQPPPYSKFGSTEMHETLTGDVKWVFIWNYLKGSGEFPPWLQVMRQKSGKKWPKMVILDSSKRVVT
jgi:hypothetical protein